MLTDGQTEVTHRQYLGESEREREKEGGRDRDRSGRGREEESGRDREKGGETDRQTNQPKLNKNFTHTRAKSKKNHLFDFTHHNRRTGYPINEN